MGNFELDLTSHLFYKFITVVSSMLLYHMYGGWFCGWILFAGFVACMGEERLPQRVMFGELVGGKGYSGGHKRTGWCI